MGNEAKDHKSTKQDERCSQLENFNTEAGGLTTWLKPHASSGGSIFSIRSFALHWHLMNVYSLLATGQYLTSWTKSFPSGSYKRTATIYSLSPPSLMTIHCMLSPA